VHADPRRLVIDATVGQKVDTCRAVGDESRHLIVPGLARGVGLIGDFFSESEVEAVAVKAEQFQRIGVDALGTFHGGACLQRIVGHSNGACHLRRGGLRPLWHVVGESVGRAGCEQREDEESSESYELLHLRWFLRVNLSAVPVWRSLRVSGHVRSGQSFLHWPR